MTIDHILLWINLVKKKCCSPITNCQNRIVCWGAKSKNLYCTFLSWQIHVQTLYHMLSFQALNHYTKVVLTSNQVWSFQLRSFLEAPVVAVTDFPLFFCPPFDCMNLTNSRQLNRTKWVWTETQVPEKSSSKIHQVNTLKVHLRVRIIWDTCKRGVLKFGQKNIHWFQIHLLQKLIYLHFSLFPYSHFFTVFIYIITYSLLLYFHLR